MDADVELAGIGRYRRHGAGSPVVILSNPAADPSWWAAPFVSTLGDAGYEAITFVHTGEGWSPSAVVRDVAAFIEHLEVDRVRLIGWSQGAAIAQEVALQRPDLVASAALVATYARQNTMDRVLQDAYRTLAAGGDELDPVRLALLFLTSYPADLLGDDAFVNPRVDGMRHWAAKPADSDRPQRAAAFIAGYHERLPALEAMLPPCLIIGFGLDTDTFVARAREVAEAIPYSRYVELPDAGHLEPVLAPNRVLRPILDFFADLPPGQAG